jgi:hypothetical protein
VKKRRREPRREAKSASLLSLERRVQEAVKIIGGGRAQRADVEEILNHMSKQCEWWKWERSRVSKDQKEFAKQYSAALRKVLTLTKDAPDGFRAPPPPLGVTAPEFGIDRSEVFDHEHLLRHLRLLTAISECWEKSELKKPIPSAEDKKLAAWAALYLCERHNMEPVTTKTGVFCRLAAVLYGDPDANLQHHCRVVVDERKAGSKAFMRWRFVGREMVWGNRPT